jgi:hypothetical protein
MVFVDLPDLLGNLLILFLAYAFRVFQPPIKRRAWNMKITTEPFHWIMPFFRELPDRQVFIKMASQR